MPDQPIITLNDGRTMPQLGFGTWQVEEDAEAKVASALSVGYRAVDTARIYGNEAEVGRAVRGTKEKIFVTTKLWNADHGYDAALRAFDESFKRLNLSWVDLYLIHWPLPSRGLYVETWRALVKLRDEGRVRSIGVSNFQVEHLERIIDDTGVVPATNQVELHPTFQQTELRAFHEQNGIATTSWSPLGRGKSLDNPTIARIAEKHGRTPAQVVLRWHLDSGLVVIPKASSRERQAENLDIFGFALDRDDMTAMARMDDPNGRGGPDPATFEQPANTPGLIARANEIESQRVGD